jgi:hypothetical protein
MALRDFVAETIKRVIDGIAAAQQHTKQKNAAVNPKLGFHAQKQVDYGRRRRISIPFAIG